MTNTLRLPSTGTDEDAAVAGIRALLRLIGEDPDRPGLEDTPRRVINAYRELCTLRGVRATGASMVTSSLTGAFRDDPAARAEFMALTHGAT